MFIDLRSSWILEELVALQGRVSINFIMEKYSVSARQIDYSLTKINDYLAANNGQKITKNNGDLISNFDVRAVFSKVQNSQQNVYIFSEEERSMMIILQLVGQKHQLSLQDFIIDLSISKNTALKNLKDVKQKLEKYQLQLKYSRAQGYLILGDENQIRLLIRNLIDSVMKDEIKKNFILTLLQIGPEVEEISQGINRLEERLGIVYTDGRRYSVSLLMAILLRRIQKGYVLAEFNDVSDIKDTLEYQEITALFFETAAIPEIELAYLTLCLLSIDISKMTAFPTVEIPELRNAILKMIELFEKQACVIFTEKATLIGIFLQHLKPAYYRVKYALSLSKSFDEALLKEAADKEFSEIYQMVTASISPLEDLFAKALPTQEIRLLTLIFAGELRKKKMQPSEKFRAAVVCSEGISVSRILYVTLSELIPEIDFLKPLSLKELDEIPAAEYDLIIAPFYLNTPKKLVVIDPVITKKNGNLIREKILSQVYGINNYQLSVDGILEIIRKSAAISDEKKLTSQLVNYLYGTPEATSQSAVATQMKLENLNLVDLFNEKSIQRVVSVKDWSEALRLAAAPLEKQGCITSDYIQKIISNYQKAMPHIVFGQEIAIPHANYEEAVREVGMSMLIVEEGVTFSQAQQVHIIILLATPDKNSHLTAMLQLLELSAAESDVQRIIQEASAEEVLNILRHYQ